MKKDSFYLLHIMNAISDTNDYVRGYKLKDFLDDKKTQDSVIRQIEIIGEAVKNISKGLIKKYPEVKWNDIARTRDKLIHGYFGVDIRLVWDIVRRELPILNRQIEKILKDIE